MCKNIEIKSFFSDWRITTLDHAKKYSMSVFKGITAMSDTKKIEWINEKRLRGVTFQELHPEFMTELRERQKRGLIADFKILCDDSREKQDIVDLAEHRILYLNHMHRIKKMSDGTYSRALNVQIKIAETAQSRIVRNYFKKLELKKKAARLGQG